MSLAILLATYNGDKYLEEQIDSLLSQTYSDFTVYIHDDGSSDATKCIVKRFSETYPEKITFLDYPSAGGAKNNFYSLLQRVESDCYMFCDQDDVWMPDKVELSFKKLQETETAYPDLPCLIFTDLRVVDYKLNTVSDSFMECKGFSPEDHNFREILAHNIAPGCTMLFNRKCRDLAVSIRSIDNFPMHDTLIMLAAEICGKVEYIDHQTILYRQHSGNTVGLQERKFNEWFREKAANVMQGIQLEKSREIVEWHRKMIPEICSFHGILPENQPIIEDLKSLSHVGKFERIRIYQRNHILKSDWKNTWKIILV